MTREEFDTNFTPSPDEYQKCSCGNQMYDHMRILIYINSLEKTIKNLEQQLADYKKRIKKLKASKTCDGCKYEFKYGYLGDGIDICTMCSRDDKLKDYYEPKDK